MPENATSTRTLDPADQATLRHLRETTAAHAAELKPPSRSSIG